MICGIKSRITLLLLVLVLALPCLPLYSDVTLTEEEYNSLMTLIDESTMEQDALRMDLKISQQELKNVKAELNEVKNTNSQLSNEVLELRINSQLREESWKQQKKEAARGRVESFFWGFGIGSLSGSAATYKAVH